ncbi:MAG: glycosyltransferase family 4 protein [Acidobacteriota bacterium]
MRIGYLLEQEEDIRRPPFNGPANHIRQVVRHLNGRGHGVTVLFRSQDRLWATEDLKAFEPVTVRKTDLGWQRTLEGGCRRIQATLGLPYLGYFESRRFAWACHQVLSDCDLFYERFSWMHYGGLLAARRQGVPWILEYNGDPLADLEAQGIAPTGVQLPVARRIMRRVLERADHVIATGAGWQRNCIEHWHVAPERSSVVENGTELLGLLNRNDLRSFRDGSDGPPETTVVYLGGFYPWHGIDKLLDATALLIKQGVRLRLNLIGSGRGETESRDHARRLGLEGIVHFLGRLTAEQYAPLLASADVGVSPYCGWPEYSGLKIFDYKAAGLACVASGENGNPPTLRHGETGWIVPPCSEAGLAEALALLARDVDLRRRLGRAARQDAERRNDWTQTARNLEAVFHRVTGGRGVGAVRGRKTAGGGMTRLTSTPELQQSHPTVRR